MLKKFLSVLLIYLLILGMKIFVFIIIIHKAMNGKILEDLVKSHPTNSL